ncbi:protein OS-9 isoform X2 [Oncorhynchus tshawytscha]|uniref:protein OS-9 isoform X2 n=1 Tax=Oncorhynchus tshawytscha TaxID=74940 RepID=UPI000D0A71CE|nr:protein OS-9 isoform X2 [Oncorhynchus tshawytscha]
MAASVVRWLRGLYVFFLTCQLSVLAFLNLEELNEVKYGIQILPDPVIMGQAKTEEVMLVSSKYKQMYECRLPAQAVRFHQDRASEPDSQGYTGPGIPDLLKPMHTAPCLVKTKDWWTYEFCYGQHIRQYHLEDTDIKGDVLFLGYYDSEFDWNNETAKASKQHRLKRYHSQSYVNGSKCDLNGNPRETEVRFVCEEGSGDYVARVDEPQSCRYVLTVHTTRTCQHPFLRPPYTAKPQGIVCQPALSTQQYMDYVKAQVSDTKRKVEQISEELKTLDEMLAGDEGTDEDSATPTDDPDVLGSDTKDAVLTSEEPKDSDFWEGVTKPGSTTATDTTSEHQAGEDAYDNQLTDNEVTEDAFGDEQFNFKIITDPADLMKFVQHLKESNRKKAENEAKQEREELQNEKEKERDEEGDEEEHLLLQEFEEEIADISVPSANIEEMKGEMQKEFDNIIDEAQQELETEGLKGEFDRTQATQTLEATLDKLLDRLEDKEARDTEAEPQTEGGQRANDPARGSPSLAPRQPGKIEVKIITRRTAEEAGDQWLTEEDTKSFRELLINLLTGGTEEVYKEQKRQQELENNYRFVWGDGQEEAQSTSTAPDSDDVEL